MGLVSSPRVSFARQSVIHEVKTDIFDAICMAFEWGILLEVSCLRKSGNEILSDKDIVARRQEAQVI